MTQNVRSTLTAAIDTTGVGGTTGEEVQNIADSAVIGRVKTITSADSPYSLSAGDDFILLCDATSGVITVNLPTLAAAAHRLYLIKKIDVSANAVTVDGSGAENIEGSATLSLATQYVGAILAPGAAEWMNWP